MKVVIKLYDYVDLKGFLDYSDNVNWGKLSGNIIRFGFKGRNGNLKVVSYEKHREIVNVVYDEIHYQVRDKDFLKGDLSAITPLKFKYFKGDLIETALQTFTVCDSKQEQERVYSCRCDTCNCVSTLTEKDLDRKHTCHYCRGFKLLEGETDLAITHPEIAVLLKNRDLRRELNKNSDTYVDWICGECGLTVYHKQVKSVVKNGLTCMYCSDSFSFGEKFSYYTLHQLGMEVTYEYRPTWARGKRYDLYAPKESLIVEVHGLHHYADVYAENTHEVVSISDTFKREIATELGIQRYVELDCRYSDHVWIEKQIRESALGEYDLSLVDFGVSLRFALGKKGEWVCRLWNNGMTLSEIETTTKLNRTSIRYSLIRGASIGLCDYNSKEGLHRGRDSMKRTVVLLNTVQTFEGVKETARAFNLNTNALRKACKEGGYLGYSRRTGELLQWGFLNDYLDGAYIVKRKFHEGSRKVVCITTGEVFENVQLASQTYGITNYLHILDVCEGKRRYAGKFPVSNIPLSWVYLEEYEEQQRENEEYYGGLFDDET